MSEQIKCPVCGREDIPDYHKEDVKCPQCGADAKRETDNLAYYKTCALTFDDGPVSTNTPKVLDALMETGTRATFFVIGNRIDDNRIFVQREHDNGHAVASHNWHHGNATKSSGAALRRMPEGVISP